MWVTASMKFIIMRSEIYSRDGNKFYLIRSIISKSSYFDTPKLHTVYGVYFFLLFSLFTPWVSIIRWPFQKGHLKKVSNPKGEQGRWEGGKGKHQKYQSEPGKLTQRQLTDQKKGMWGNKIFDIWWRTPQLLCFE